MKVIDVVTPFNVTSYLTWATLIFAWIMPHNISNINLGVAVTCTLLIQIKPLNDCSSWMETLKILPFINYSRER